MQEAGKVMLHRALVRAEERQTLAWAEDNSERSYLRRNMLAGRLIAPLPHMYAIAEEWRKLGIEQRITVILRSVALKNPRCTLCSLSAAWMLGLTDDVSLQRKVHVLVPRGVSMRSGGDAVQRHESIGDSHGCVEIDGVHVPSVERVLLDCARDLRFCDSLPIWEMAYRRDLTSPGRMQEYLESFSGPYKGIRAARLVWRYANGHCENGGESKAHAVILQLGFVDPEIQVPFVNPLTHREIRPDFLWRVKKGLLIAGELDGMRKYKDEAMRNGRDVEEVLVREKDRETALNSLGVLVVRFHMGDVRHPQELRRKLSLIGVPRVFGAELKRRERLEKLGNEDYYGRSMLF